MTGRVRVHTQGLDRVVRAVEQQAGPQGDGALVLGVERVPVGDGAVEVELLRDGRVGPRRGGQLLDLLERQGDPGERSTSQSCPSGSAAPSAGGSSPGRYSSPSRAR